MPHHFDSQNFIENAAGERFCYYLKNGHFRNVAVVCVHGAGFSGLSFSQFAAGLEDEALVVSVDLRGHGLSVKTGEMTFANLVADLEVLIPKILKLHQTQEHETYKVVLVGHSLGGSLITGIRSPLLNVLCLIVIDITEQTALASLGSMQTILRRKPQHFSSH